MKTVKFILDFEEKNSIFKYQSNINFILVENI